VVLIASELVRADPLEPCAGAVSRTICENELRLLMSELDFLKKPEYIHVVLNHLVIYGTILGALALIVSLVLRSRAAQITALIITLIAAASAYPVLVSGQRAYKTVRAMADDNGAEALDEHMDRAEKTIGLFYLLALVALAALLAPIKWPKTGLPLTAITLVFALVCFGLSLYIAQEGGRVRHPEFRPAEPGETAKPSPETGHHNE
jgi:glucan phosphoethanolaminetransferase (alkaline phosphatase superfamily)